MTPAIAVAAHAELRLVAFTTRFRRPLGEVDPASVAARLTDPEGLLADCPAPRDEDVRRAVRDLLRHGGYKPTGRGKPSSEYLVRAAEEGALRSINAAVDAGNVVSLASGFPISVVDLDRLRPPLSVAIAEPGTSYVFNPAGQTIDVAGLLCLSDVDGPSANAVKDAQRTKTDASTLRTLSLVWGTVRCEERLAPVVTWYRSLLERLGAETAETERVDAD